MPNKETNGWGEYQKLVLHELKDHSRELANIQQAIQTIHVDIASLKIKSGAWGALAGLIPVFLLMLFKLLD